MCNELDNVFQENKMQTYKNTEKYQQAVFLKLPREMLTGAKV